MRTRQADRIPFNAISAIALGSILCYFSMLGCTRHDASEAKKKSASDHGATSGEEAAEAKKRSASDHGATSGEEAAVKSAMNYLKKDKSMYTNYKWEARRPVPKNEKGEWVVEITMIPAKPGAFVYVTVSKDGVVLNLERGE